MIHLGGQKSLHWLHHILEEAPFELCGEIVMGGTTPSIGLLDPICNF